MQGHKPFYREVHRVDKAHYACDLLLDYEMDSGTCGSRVGIWGEPDVDIEIRLLLVDEVIRRRTLGIESRKRIPICSGHRDQRAASFRIDIVEIPFNHPHRPSREDRTAGSELVHVRTLDKLNRQVIVQPELQSRSNLKAHEKVIQPHHVLRELF